MARPSSPVQDHYILAAALETLEAQKRQLEEKIANVRSMMSGRKSVASVAAPAEVEKAVSEDKPAKRGRRKRVLSEEARLRIAAAQKKRWAAFRKVKKND